MKNITVIHHKSCFDGVAAAWVVKRYFELQQERTKEEINIQIIPAQYGDPFPEFKDIGEVDIYIVDFSYDRVTLERVFSAARSLLVLDHHKTAQEVLQGFPAAVFDMNRSGAGIAWDWFFMGRPRPWLIDCVEDRDLWKFKLPFTRRQMAHIATVPMTVEEFGKLVDLEPLWVADRGDGILDYIRNYGLKAIEHAFMREIGGYAFWIINAAYMNCSDHLDLMMQVKEFDRAASFYLREDGKWQFSLRSRGDLDVSAIAKKYGGGGHKNAAGFEVTVLPWEKR